MQSVAPGLQTLLTGNLFIFVFSNAPSLFLSEQSPMMSILLSAMTPFLLKMSFLMPMAYFPTRLVWCTLYWYLSCIAWSHWEAGPGSVVASLFQSQVWFSQRISKTILFLDWAGHFNSVAVTKGERTTEQPESKTTVSLRAAGRQTIHRKHQHCLSSSMKLPMVGKRRCTFNRGKLVHERKPRERPQLTASAPYPQVRGCL